MCCTETFATRYKDHMPNIQEKRVLCRLLKLNFRMRILIVAATSGEVQPSLLFLKEQGIDVLITGVGMVETAFALGERLAQTQYDLLLNVGVAGSFSRAIQIGDVLGVSADRLIELGAEDGEQFLPIEEMGLAESVFKVGVLTNLPPTGLPDVKAITVNTVHGNNDSIEMLSKRLDGAVLESMEGAAVLFAAKKKGVSVMQVRAVSNYVERRNTSSWNMPLAVEKLNEWLQRYLHSLLS
ncbi:futalosine hydrolase [Sphingobacterium corticis]|uniref:Futalosine hydrolase n=1 Tax=Sphingobacterium corticis TaxID=1812823 RepID=A0ABW5NJR0_9SPHI